MGHGDPPVAFIGEDVGGMAKGRAGMHSTAACNLFEPIVGTISATDIAELTAEAVAEQVKKLANAGQVKV